MARYLTKAEFGNFNSALTGFISFLSLPVAIISTALIHHIAHYRGTNDDARLQGLLAGAQKSLLHATISGSVLAVVLVKPLSLFFHFQTPLMLAVLVCVLVGLWSNFALALCQGMGWFKRLAIIQVVGVGLRLLFGVLVVKQHPTAPMALTGTTFAFLANIFLLYWWKSIFRHGSTRTSPWHSDFLNFLLVTAAYVGGNFFFLNGDSLVAKKYFSGDDLGSYQLAARWCINLPGILLPLLQVMFASRSESKDKRAVTDQRILLALYAVGLACGAAVMIALRNVLITVLLGSSNPEAASMLIPYTVTMMFVGLGQATAMWSLASRWYKLSILYGALGLAYWITLLLTGRSPGALLRVMPAGAGLAFLVLLASWLWAYRCQSIVKKTA